MVKECLPLRLLVCSIRLSRVIAWPLLLILCCKFHSIVIPFAVELPEVSVLGHTSGEKPCTVRCVQFTHLARHEIVLDAPYCCQAAACCCC